MTDTRKTIGAVVLVAVLLLTAAGGPGQIRMLVMGDGGCPHSLSVPDAQHLREARAATLCLLNRERAARHLAPLAVDARLTNAAQAHSEDEGRRRYYAHETPDAITPAERVQAAGMALAGSIVGENIHWGINGHASPRQIVEDWMHSPGHRRNILRREYTAIGIGIGFQAPQIVQGEAAVYTTDFAGPTLSAADR